MSYLVTVKVELVGVPHTWVTLTDANGNSVSYGYAAEDGNYKWPELIDYGRVFKEDGITGERAGSQEDFDTVGWYGTYEVTSEQYQSIVDRAEAIRSNPGTYLGVGNNCVDFMRSVLSAGNVPHPLGLGPHPASLIPVRERPQVSDRLLEHLANNISGNTLWLSNFMDGGLSINEFNDLFTSATSANPPIRRDPLTLDLDGDGIETIGVNDGAYFDHDGNGFAEQTGWIGADDGLLVWDRDGDGRINDGSELFGDQTRLQDGSLAANGFAALAEWDANADGIIDVNDSVWANLKVWRDADGDGYSSTSELHTLDTFGIAGINLSYTAVSNPDGQGNTQIQAGTFTKTDGSTGALGCFELNRDTLYTVQEDYLAVTPDIAALPDLRGYGNVYDLQQALVRDTSGQLKSLVESFIAETSPNNRTVILDQMLLRWTGADTIDPASRGVHIDARHLVALERFYARDFVGTDDGPNPNASASALLNQSYEGLSEMLYAQLAAQTHLKSLYDLIAYSWDTTTQSIQGDLSAVTAAIQTQLNTDPELGRLTLGEFSRSIKALQAEATLDFATFRDAFVAQGVEFGIIIDAAGAHSFYGTSGNDVLTGTPDTDYLTGMAGDDTLLGSGGNNAIYGGDGNDTIIVAGSGTNMLYGGDGNDVFDHYAYGDTLFDGGAGNDGVIIRAQRDYGTPAQRNTFIGGTGDDAFMAGAGTDTYFFNRGDGRDTLNDYDVGRQGATDTLVFGAGILATDVHVSRNGDHLVLTVNDPTNPQALDSVTIESWFIDPIFNVEAITFEDGTVWGTAELITRATTGTEVGDTLTGWQDLALTYYGLGGNDTISAQSNSDTVYGGDGDDTVSDSGGSNLIDGGAGNDTVTLYGSGNSQIYGGEGNDFLDHRGLGSNLFVGGAGDDLLLTRYARDYGDPSQQNVFLGGAGNDALMGGAGTDTYFFNRGDGSDTLNDYDVGRQGATDTLVFGAGILATDVHVSRNGDHLVLTVNDPTNPQALDSVTIESWFIDPIFNVEAITFEDGTVWDAAVLHIKLTTGSEGADTMSGWQNLALTYYGFGGNDTISAQGNNDIVYGGDGDDTITDSDGNNLIDGGAGNDTVTLYGSGNSQIYGGEGNDTIIASHRGTSRMEGGAGDDILRVVPHNGITYFDPGYYDTHNTFVGGIGNDRLEGSSGYDVYVFNRGDGQDTIRDLAINNSAGYADPDRVEFGAGITPDDLIVERNGNHLVIRVNDPSNPDANDSMTIENRYVSESYAIETFAFADGTTLTDVQMVELINYAPTLVSPLADYTATEDTFLNIAVPSGTFSDPDNDTLAYSATLVDGSTLPAWLVFDGATRTFSGTPGNADVGVFAIRVMATDPRGESVSDTFQLTVQNVNDAPIVMTPITDQGVSEGQAWSFTIPTATFDDVDAGDALSYTAMLADGSALPGWLSFDSVTQTFSGTPTNGYSGIYDIRVTATDTTGTSVSDVFSLTVADTISNVFTGTSGKDVLTGTVGADTLLGLAGADTLYGYGGNDMIDGGAGSDTMIGGAGDDTYVVDANGDVVTENADEGTDTVRSSISHTLVANVENLVLTGTGKINGTGNTLDNVLTGNSANNTLTGGEGNDNLDGGGGSDTFRGGTGNDVYVVDVAGDVVTEYANEGTDAVKSGIAYTLGANVENLELTGTSAINGTGNTLDNALTGNAANNTLSGNAGNDTLDGGAGTDTLVGGTGNDTYVFNRGDGADTVQENDATAGNADTARIGTDTLDIVLARSGNNLVLSLHGGTDTLTMQNWYAGTQYQTEEIEAADGSTLLNTQVEQLIQAMATFSAQNGGISWDQAIDQRPDDVQAILAANWQAAA